MMLKILLILLSLLAVSSITEESTDLLQASAVDYNTVHIHKMQSYFELRSTPKMYILRIA